MTRIPNWQVERPLVLGTSEPVASVFLSRPLLHPSIFKKRILRVEGRPQAGDWVGVYSVDDADTPQLFAYGIFNDRSEIAVRLFRWWGQFPDEAYWDQLIDRAISLRTDCLKLDQSTNAYRLIHAEADGFPGLAVDRYNDVLSAEVFSLGMYQRARPLMEKLCQKMDIKHWLVQRAPCSWLRKVTTFRACPRANCRTRSPFKSWYQVSNSV